MGSTTGTLQQVMFSLIEIWKASGKTQLEFCKGKDIAYHTFHYWLRKYNQQDQLTDGRSGFRRIVVRQQEGLRAGGVELVYPDGRKLVFHSPVDASFLRSLLS
jgi:hypothetical protein